MKPETRIISKSIISEVFVWGLLGVLVRAVYVFWVVGKYGKAQFSDFQYMHQLAASLAAGDGFTIDGVRIFNQSVGYPAFLSVFYKLFGSDVWVALAVNILLGGISAALLYLLTIKLFANIEWLETRLAARLAALLAVIYPDSLLHCALVSAENLLIPLMLLLVLSIIVCWGRSWMAAGILAAFACSVKAHVLFFCLMIPLIWYVMGRRYFLYTIWTGLTAAICLMPWTILNHRASGGYILPFAAVSGEVFLDGTNPGAVGKPTNRISLSDYENNSNPVEMDRLKLKQAVKYVRDDPMWYARLCLKKAVLAFSPARDFLFQFRDQDRFFGSFFSRWFPTVFNGFVIVFIISGMIMVRRKPDVLAVGCCLFCAQLILQVVFFAYPRYRFPFLFCLLPFCGCFIDVILRNMIGKEKNGFPLGNK